MRKVFTAACAVFMLAGVAMAAHDQMDENFVKTVAHKGAMEVEFGKLAAQRGAHADVKKLAEHMVTDHSKANEDLKGITGTMGIVVEGQHADYRATHDKMTALQGAEFDRAFVDWTVKGHTESVALFNNYIKNGKHEQLKAFATKTLPAIQHHLDMAKQCQAALGKGAFMDMKDEQPISVSAESRVQPLPSASGMANQRMLEGDRMSSQTSIRDERFQREPLVDPAYDVRYEQQPSFVSDRFIDGGTCSYESGSAWVEPAPAEATTGSAGSGHRAGFTRNVYE